MLLQEAKKTFILAIPMILGQWINHGMQLIDTAMIGQVGVLPLAAAGFSANFSQPFLMFGYGFAIAISILISQAYGSGDRHQEKVLIHHSLLVSGLAGLVLAVLFFSIRHLGYGLGQPAEVVDAAQGYLVWLAISMVPLLLLGGLKSYADAVGRPWLPLAYMLLSLLLNVLFNAWFIYGGLGVPALGLTGAGMATALSRTLALLLLWMHLQRSQEFALSGAWPPLSDLNGAVVKRFLLVAVPAGFQITLEVALFNVATVMMGWLGAVMLAAHMVALNLAAMAFMVPLGISFAVSIRIGHALGRQDVGEIKRIGLSTFLGTGLVMFGTGLVLFVFRDVMPTWFVDESDPLADEVLLWAAKFLVVATVFQLGDGLNMVAVGTLRGVQDMRFPTVIFGVVYWLFTLPLALFLGFRYELGDGWAIGLGWGGMGIWVALAVGLTVCAVLTIARFWVVVRRMSL